MIVVDELVAQSPLMLLIFQIVLVVLIRQLAVSIVVMMQVQTFAQRLVHWLDQLLIGGHLRRYLEWILRGFIVHCGSSIRLKVASTGYQAWPSPFLLAQGQHRLILNRGA